MWHLKGWTGSVHLSVDQSCARCRLDNHFGVALLRPGTSEFRVAFLNAPIRHVGLDPPGEAHKEGTEAAGSTDVIRTFSLG